MGALWEWLDISTIGQNPEIAMLAENINERLRDLDVSLDIGAIQPDPGGTAVDNQIAVWIDANHIEGDPDLIWTGAYMAVGASPPTSGVLRVAGAMSLKQGDGTASIYFDQATGDSVLQATNTNIVIKCDVGSTISLGEGVHPAGRIDWIKDSAGMWKPGVSNPNPDIGENSSRVGTFFGNALDLTANAQISGTLVVGSDPGGAEIIRTSGQILVKHATDSHISLVESTGSKGAIFIVVDGGSPSIGSTTADDFHLKANSVLHIVLDESANLTSIVATSGLTIDGDKQTRRMLHFRSVSPFTDRFIFEIDEINEVGGNVGSDLIISRYSDVGVFLEDALKIVRSTGAVTVTQSFGWGGGAAIAESDDVASVATHAAEDLVLGASTSAWKTLGMGTSLQVLRVNVGATALEWGAPAGGGDVIVSGTPANNQIAIWTDSTHIEGDADFTWDGTTFGIVGADTDVIMNLAGPLLADGLKLQVWNAETDGVLAKLSWEGGFGIRHESTTRMYFRAAGGAWASAFIFDHNADIAPTGGGHSFITLPNLVYAPTAGSADMQWINMAYTLNQTGANTSDVYGIRITATETAVTGTHWLVLAAVGGSVKWEVRADGLQMFYNRLLGMMDAAKNLKLITGSDTGAIHMQKFSDGSDIAVFSAADKSSTFYGAIKPDTGSSYTSGTAAIPWSHTYTDNLTAYDAIFLGEDVSTVKYAYIRAQATNNRGIWFQTFVTATPTNRWLLFTDGAAESGSNAGSNFQLSSYTDAGAFLNSVFIAIRSSGIMQFPNDIQVDAIGEYSTGVGVWIDGVVLKDGDVYIGNSWISDLGTSDGFAFTVDATSSFEVQYVFYNNLGNEILHLQKALGIEIFRDGVEICNIGANGSDILIDLVNEWTTAAGVTVDGLLLKDGNVELVAGQAIYMRESASDRMQLWYDTTDNQIELKVANASSVLVDILTISGEVNTSIVEWGGANNIDEFHIGNVSGVPAAFDFFFQVAGQAYIGGILVWDGSDGVSVLGVQRPTDDALMNVASAPAVGTLRLGGGNQDYVDIYAHTTHVARFWHGGAGTAEIQTDKIAELNTAAGVLVDGLLIKDSGIPVGAVTAHEAALTILESQITDGAVLVRLADAAWIDLTDAGDSTAHFHSADRARAVHSGTQATSTIVGGTFADALIAQSNVTQHQAALVILESQITDGAILARVGGTETITGLWDFSHASGIKVGVVTERVAAAGILIDDLLVKDGTTTLENVKYYQCKLFSGTVLNILGITGSDELIVGAATASLSEIQFAVAGGVKATLDGSALNLQVPLERTGTQILTSRQTGWVAATGTATRSTFVTSAVSLSVLAEHVKALIDDFMTHGAIGA